MFKTELVRSTDAWVVGVVSSMHMFSRRTDLVKEDGAAVCAERCRDGAKAAA